MTAISCGENKNFSSASEVPEVTEFDQFKYRVVRYQTAYGEKLSFHYLSSDPILLSNQPDQAKVYATVQVFLEDEHQYEALYLEFTQNQQIFKKIYRGTWSVSSGNLQLEGLASARAYYGYQQEVIRLEFPKNLYSYGLSGKDYILRYVATAYDPRGVVSP